MNTMFRYWLLALVALLTLTNTLKAQVITDPILAGLIKKQNSFFEARVPEKVYVQTDKPDYITGDTLRMKAYVLNADYLVPAERSGLLYVELDDVEGKVAKRLMLPIAEGVAWCDIVLDEKNVPVGGYTLRAYTNWMRNFGEDYIYKKHISVSPAAGNATLVRANFNHSGNKVEAALQFTTLNGQILRLKDMELKVMEGRKNLAKDQINTGMDGMLNVNFEASLSATAKPLTIQAKEIIRGRPDQPVLTIPLLLNRAENTDVQFMPEGGNLVAGIATKVGFKAIGEDGKGAGIAGKILNSKQQEVATFKSGYAGMGSFKFTPVAGEIYTAKLNGINKTYQLPAVNPVGTGLNIDMVGSNDSLSVTVTASAELISQAQNYYLIGRARSVVCYAQAIRFENGRAIKKVARSLFPSGIARFTLHNAANIPLNERQVFIDHQDGLKFTVTNHTPDYSIRDSIALGIEVMDKNNKPVQGYFSVSITDDNQVKTDSLGVNIWNNLLMTSDLKGNIENPGYYFINPSPQKHTELDNLMLTQGWIGYDWKDVFAPVTPPLAFRPEQEFVIKGKATNVFGKPVENSNVVMILKNPTAVRDTLTDKSGGFLFKGLVPLDSAVIVLQARNKRGRAFNIGLDVEEFIEPSFKNDILHPPWYLNMDTALLKNSQTKAIQTKTIEEYNGEGNLLREVQINAKRAIKGSKNLNGPGGADEILEEEVFHKANHMSLKNLLAERYKKDFQMMPFYSLYGRQVKLVIDGREIEPVKVGAMPAPLTIPEYMDFLTAEDIKGIEIMNSSKYAMAYDPLYISKLAKAPLWLVPIFLEVTTYSGNGAYMKKTPGTYLYRPIPFTLPTQFYSPKYTVKNKGLAIGTDMRSTLHWEPNIITDAAGKATVSFYMADKPVNYTVVVEGFNGQGDVGYGRHGVKNSGVK